MTHQFDLKKQALKRICKGGYRFLITGDQCPALKSMALATIELKKGGIREPHWHPNADEMTYCAEGKALVTLFSPGNIHETFSVSAGEVFYIPRGYIHHIENIHTSSSRFILAYSHHKPEDLDLSESAASMDALVLAATFGGTKQDLKKLKTKDAFIAQKKHIGVPLLSPSSPHKFNLEKIMPQIHTEGGLARIANQKNFPRLEHLALFSLRIAKNGIREPHWHPNATELNLVLSGKARLTIYSPGGKKDHFTLGEGQGSIIPAGYFHHIENIGSKELHMTVFFNNPLPDDIGLSGALSAYSNEVLASTFSLDPKFFEKMQKFKKDRMIVSGGG